MIVGACFHSSTDLQHLTLDQKLDFRIDWMILTEQLTTPPIFDYYRSIDDHFRSIEESFNFLEGSFLLLLFYNLALTQFLLRQTLDLGTHGN